ncbi:MAG: shikimate dehydrogenase [Phycisphaerales bacterium]|nr:shikimate dehydrogenase [Phycisphaerales bacterium]
MARLITSIACSTAGELIAAANSALAEGADLVELRLDALGLAERRSTLKLASSLPRGRWLATCRSVREGGACMHSSADRFEILAEAVSAGAAFVDIEAADLVEAGAQAPTGARLVISHHDFNGRPSDLADLFERLEAIGRDRSPAGSPAVAKVAWKSEGPVDSILACELMRVAPDRRIAIAMGEKGLASRALAAKFGAFGTFCSPEHNRATAPGQVSLAEMLHQYRWQRQTPDTRVLGVLGNPVAHSLSPAIFNAQFDQSDFDAVYLPTLVETESELHAFLDACRERPWFGALGFSVTVPHKRAALAWAGDHVEPLARRIGAVNTLHFTDAGVRAYNTDYSGALAAITQGMGITDPEFANLPVAVLGAGGVARAVVAGLCDRGAKVTIYNRTAQSATDLASEFGCDAANWDDRHRHDAKLIVNCTSVGMHPRVDASPMPPDGLSDKVAVFDTVYNPRETKLLRQAREAGAVTIDGVAMFVHQAAEQYRIWTGSDADLSLFERIVTDRLAESRQTSADRASDTREGQ